MKSRKTKIQKIDEHENAHEVITNYSAFFSILKVLISSGGN